MGAHDSEPPAGSTEQPNVQAGRIGYALRELTLSLRGYERGLAHRMRLKPTEYQAMEHILDGGGALGAVELATRLGLAPGTTSELVDRLEQFGHVVRGRDETDRRRVRLAPTPSATAEIIAAITPAVHELDRLASTYAPADQEVIRRFLLEASATLRSHTSPGERAGSGAPSRPDPSDSPMV